MAKTSQDRKSTGAAKASRGGGGGPDDLGKLKVPELRERAQGLGIDGASGMKKDKLVTAIRDAEGSAGAAPARGGRASAAMPGVTSADGDATLRKIDEKLAEVLGLARAATGAADKVAGLAEEEDHRTLLAAMRRDAEETARRCEEALAGFGARRTAIEEKAGETEDEATEMMQTYLGGDDVDALDGFEFLVMAEAAEVSHWAILRTMNAQARESAVEELAGFAIPLQERHFEQVLTTAVSIARGEDALSEA